MFSDESDKYKYYEVQLHGTNEGFIVIEESLAEKEYNNILKIIPKTATIGSLELFRMFFDKKYKGIDANKKGEYVKNISDALATIK